MSLPAETTADRPAENVTQLTLVTAADRRADVEAKQRRVAALLQEAGCDALLVLEPANFAWLTGGATARGVLDPDRLPALLYTPEERWLVCSNVDTQRLFDEEIDGLGYQLKEWSWYRGREPRLAELCRNRRVACDRARDSCTQVADVLLRSRRVVTIYEQACYRALGQILSHALEATCRHLQVKDTEREIAGQLSHRLVHHGVLPVAIEVAADGRSRRYRQGGYTAVPVQRYCVLTATARKYGLYATASRSMCFGEPDPAFRQEHDAACRVSATYVASTWPDAVPREILNAGRHVYRISNFEHDWRQAPPGFVTGRSPVELSVGPQTEELFQAGWVVTWRASVGAACSCDTFLVTAEGPKIVTPPETWPLKRIRIQGAGFVRPDLLQR